jgi:hypothetical protein
MGKTVNTIMTTTWVDPDDTEHVEGTNKKYGPITGWTTNDHEAYIVKLGGVILTGGVSYTIEGTTQQTSKVALSDAPGFDYELEVRAISIGASTNAVSGTLQSPVKEAVGTSTYGVSGTVHLALGVKQVYLYSGAATDNFTLNLRNNADGTIGVNSMLSVDNTVSAVVLLGMGTAYSLTAVTIDGGEPVPVKWQNGTKTLQENKLNIISLTVIKTDENVFTVLGSVAAAAEIAP